MVERQKEDKTGAIQSDGQPENGSETAFTGLVMKHLLGGQRAWPATGEAQKVQGGFPCSPLAAHGGGLVAGIGRKREHTDDAKVQAQQRPRQVG